MSLRYLESGVWYKSHISGIFYGIGDLPLMLIANFISSGSCNLKLGSDKLPQKFAVLIINPYVVVA